MGSALAGPSRNFPRWHPAGETHLLDLEAASAAGAAPTVLYGWLDNAAEIVAALGLAAQPAPAELYHRAWQAWGDGADQRIVGSYCAITALPGGRLRLVRSPWTAPPLHYVHGPGLVGASSVMRALFAAGHPRRIDYDYLADQLLLDHHDGEPRGWYQAMGRVPL